MDQHYIYSIGHGNKSTEEFAAELQAFAITHLVDVRTKPYSGRFPQFNKAALETAMKACGITYIFLGNQLGGMPDDPECYTYGKVDYELMKEKDFFKAGISRLIRAHQNKVKLAVMCSESRPAECHRTKLIGQELLSHGISMQHIISTGLVKPQELVINELTKGRGTTDLFGNEISFTSRKTYD